MEDVLGEDAAEADWTFRSMGILWTGDVATKDGLRLKPWRMLQKEGLVTGKGERVWYGWLRRELCLGDGSAVLKRRVEAVPPEAGEFALCWETEEEAAERGRDGGGDAGDGVRAVVRVYGRRGDKVKVGVWNFAGGGREHGARAGGSATATPYTDTGVRKWVDESRLVWVGGVEREGEAWLQASELEWDALLEEARGLVHGDWEGGSEASSDDGWRPVMEEEGMAVCYSDGSHYPAGGGGRPPRTDGQRCALRRAGPRSWCVERF